MNKNGGLYIERLRLILTTSLCLPFVLTDSLSPIAPNSTPATNARVPETHTVGGVLWKTGKQESRERVTRGDVFVVKGRVDNAPLEWKREWECCCWILWM